MKILRRIRDAYRRHEIATVVAGLIALLVIAFLWPYIVIVVPAGSAGVLFSGITGTRQFVLAGEGLHITLPWQKIAIYELRYQTIDTEVTILTKDGLEVAINVTTRYRPIYRQLMTLHQEVGPQYPATIVSPEVGTAVRVIAGEFEPEEFYNVGIASLQARVIAVARERMRTRFVEVDDVFIRSIVMPRTVAVAIQHKIEQEQQALTMTHRIEFEKQEAFRKQVEAEGIRAFQAIISNGLTNQYLRYKGIEATLELAQSPNSKIIVIDGGPNGLPLVLNAESLAPGGAQPVVLPPGVQPLNMTPAVPTRRDPAPGAVPKPTPGTPQQPPPGQPPKPVP
jgi:regulator of protease activity HflC (stomatin/prohibitin superfamily)